VFPILGEAIDSRRVKIKDDRRPQF